MRRKYPWDEWLGKPRTVLLRGVHYRCSQATMCQTIRNAASARMLHVSLTNTGTEIIIEVRSEEQAVSDIRGDVRGAQHTTTTA